MSYSRAILVALSVLVVVVLLGVTCFTRPPHADKAADQTPKHPLPPPTVTNLPDPDPDNGGIQLARGFAAFVFADNLGPARHLVVRENGDVYVALRRRQENGGIIALRDTDGDGRADITRQFGDVAGTGIAIHKDHLYFGTRTDVVRFPLPDDALVPPQPFEVIVRGFPAQSAHAAKPITFDRKGHLFVNNGAPSNACQEQIRTPESPGQRPCPERETAGMWRFEDETLDQNAFDDGQHYATGLRQCVAIDYNHHVDALYLVMHGRDQLNTLFPQYYDDKDNAELPAEEFHLVREGLDAGWPYTYYDPRRDQRMIAPEYGGDGKTPVEEGKYAEPIMTFPAHWAPNDLLFYDARQFPSHYHHGAFIAFHGSWNRAPLEQQGYKVVFVPFDGETPAGPYEVFANGFAGTDSIDSPRDAEYRPMSLAIGPKGSLFVADSQKGRVWCIMYVGA